MEYNKDRIIPILSLIAFAVVGREVFGVNTIIGMAILGGIGGGFGGLISSLISHITTKRASSEIKLSQQEVSTAIDLTIEEDTSVENEKPFLYGFGGWLIYYTIGQIYTVIMTVSGMADWFYLFSSDDMNQLRSDGYSDIVDRFAILGIIGLMFSVFTILIIVATWYFALRVSRLYRNANIVYVSVNFLSVLIIYFFMLYLNSYTGEELYTFSDISGIFIGSVIFGAIWIPYFLISERVKNTFIR